MAKNKGVVLSNILEIWQEAESYSREEVLLNISHFVKNVIECFNEDGSGLYQYIIAELSEERLANDKCPDCGEPLNYDSYEEDRGEYMGTPVSEKVTVKRCLSCGWEEN